MTARAATSRCGYGLSECAGCDVKARLTEIERALNSLQQAKLKLLGPHSLDLRAYERIELDAVIDEFAAIARRLEGELDEARAMLDAASGEVGLCPHGYLKCFYCWRDAGFPGEMGR